MKEDGISFVSLVYAVVIKYSFAVVDFSQPVIKPTTL
jgi:hypothetical protein